MEKIFYPVWVTLYLLGSFLSQSLLSLAGILGLVALLPQLKKAPWKLNSPTLWACVWVLYSGINLILKSKDSSLLLSGLKDLPLFLLPLLGLLGNSKIVALFRKNPHFLNYFLNIFMVLVLAAFGRSLFQAFWQKRPATGLMSNQIYFAYALLPLFLLGAELIRERIFSRLIQIRLVILTLLTALCLFLSHTRMAWLVIALWLVVRGLPWLWAQNCKKWALSLVTGIVLACGVLWYAQPDFQNKVGRIFESQDPSKLSRSFIWSFNWQSFKENPWTGLGFEKNGAIPVDEKIRELFINAGLNPDYKIYAHNIFLQALVDNGLIGFLIWIGFWILLARGHSKTTIYFIFMAIAGLTENFFNNSRAMHSFYFVTILFLILDRYLKEVGRTHEQRTQST